MNIAIIGSGNVGGTLGSRWAKLGHKITFAVRKPEDPKIRKVLDAAGPNAHATTIPEAVKDAPVVVLTTSWEGTQDALKSAGNLSGKILIDATNPLFQDLQRGLVIGHTTSGGEQVAAWSPGARVVKAFNTTGAGNMANPKFGADAATMFICGDDAEAKATVTKLSNELGFETCDAGPLSAARYLEPLAMLWIHQAYALCWGPNFALKVIRR